MDVISFLPVMQVPRPNNAMSPHVDQYLWLSGKAVFSTLKNGGVAAFRVSPAVFNRVWRVAYMISRLTTCTSTRCKVILHMCLHASKDQHTTSVFSSHLCQGVGGIQTDWMTMRAICAMEDGCEGFWYHQSASVIHAFQKV